MKRRAYLFLAGMLAAAAAGAAPNKLIVYYFHGDARCVTCRKFETYTKELVEEVFGEAVKAGRLEHRVVNVDRKENRHYIKDYGLYSKAVVLSDTAEGKELRSKNLEDIWAKIGDEDAYKKYLGEEITSFLDTL